jgi:hypothetical protein
MADRDDRHHQRLQDEAEPHWRVWPRDEIVPDAPEDRDRNAVPNDAGDNQHKDGRNHQFRQEAQFRRIGIGHRCVPLCLPSGSHDTAEADMAHARIDRLRMARCRAIAPAVIRRT